MNSVRHRVVAAASAAVALLVPAAAPAAVTSTTISAPADQFAPAYDWLDGKGPYALRVDGVAGGSGGSDRVDIYCLRRGEATAPVIQDVAVAATGRAFSAVLDPSLPALRTPCRLRALPTAGIPADLAPFPGPRFFPSGLRDFREQTLANPNVGVLYDTDLNTVATNGLSTGHLESFGGCGLWDARPLDPSVGPDAPARNVFDCAGWADDVADFTPPTRSELQVDGRNAFTGAMATLSASGLPNVPGRPALTRTASRDAITGLLSLRESTDVVRCETQPPAYSFANASDCGRLVSSGVRFVREATMSRDGRVTTMRDRWESADGAEHTLDLLLEVDFSSQQYGIQVPWVGPDVAAYSGAASLNGPPAVPASILVRSNRAVPNGDLANPTGAVTFSTAPASIEFVSGEDPSRYMELRYLRQVPAGGALELTHTFSMAPTAGESAGLAARAEDSYGGPSVAITAPARATTSTVANVTVRGTASDNRSVAGLTVAGIPVAVAADGTWSGEVTLTPGPNTIVARATDGAGNASEATVAVTYAPVSGAPCVVPRVKGLRRISSAKKRVTGAGCRFGALFYRYVKPVKIRKGKKTITVVTRRGTALGTKQKIGARLRPGATVNVVVQGRVPKPLTSRQRAAARKKALARKKQQQAAARKKALAKKKQQQAAARRPPATG
ncbi:MAG: Ig domain protein group 1 domain protein [Solirubrobacterales bacterium]|nr:Ig domain protein group 1 domain protein [Solirubrobacterales bacterium]